MRGSCNPACTCFFNDKELSSKLIRSWERCLDWLAIHKEKMVKCHDWKGAWSSESAWVLGTLANWARWNAAKKNWLAKQCTYPETGLCNCSFPEQYSLVAASSLDTEQSKFSSTCLYWRNGCEEDKNVRHLQWVWIAVLTSLTMTGMEGDSRLKLSLPFWGIN